MMTESATVTTAEQQQQQQNGSIGRIKLTSKPHIITPSFCNVTYFSVFCPLH